MTLRCPNGHRTGPDAATDPDGRGGDHCPTCRAPLDRTIDAEPLPLWPVGVALVLSLVLIAWLWWFVWFADR